MPTGREIGTAFNVPVARGDGSRCDSWIDLRAYHAKVARLSESGSERGRSVSEVLLEFVTEEGSVSRLAILERFSGDEDIVIGTVLRDLVDSGLLSRSGRGDRAVYRVAENDEPISPEDARGHLANLLWIVVHRYGPIGPAEIIQRVPGDSAQISEGLELLLREGRIEARALPDGTLYSRRLRDSPRKLGGSGPPFRVRAPRSGMQLERRSR